MSRALNLAAHPRGQRIVRRAQRLVGPVQIEAQASVIDWLAAHPALIADCARLTGGTLALLARDGAGRGHVQPA